ncbi:MAG: DUF2332 family protein, partial [Elusimicrobiota bacterium]
MAWGDPASEVIIRADWQGAKPSLPDRIELASQAACDIAPIDLAADGAALRLLSYVWPDQHERLQRLRAAIALARRLKVRVDAADALPWVRNALAARREGQTTVLYHSVMWQYLPAAPREALRECIEAAGQRASADAPLAGLAFMLLLGPAEPLLLAAYPAIQIPWGQIGVAIFVGGWTLRSLARREFRWPLLAITIPFAVYLFAITLSFTTQQVRSPFAAMQELVKWAEMYLVAGIVVETAGRKKLGWVIAILFLVGMTQAAIGFWQFQFRGHGPEGFRILGTHFRAYGTFEQPNPFGGFMGLVWPIAAVVTIQLGILISQRQFRTRITQTRNAH